VIEEHKKIFSDLQEEGPALQLAEEKFNALSL
jgi:hypothetical protein